MEDIEIKKKIIIIGAGLAGLTAAVRLAEAGIKSALVSCQASERAQSVLAEGGINGALNTMGEDDCPENHKNDTLRAGCYLADPEAVEGLAYAAPGIIQWLDGLGVPFHRKEGVLQQRYFGGQKKRRTAYAQSSTGKVLMTALIDEARKYEAEGYIKRYPHHEFMHLLIRHGEKDWCAGAEIRDLRGGALLRMYGRVLLAYGGLNGFFPEKTTGTTANSGSAAASVFSDGVAFSNLEMIQYHPTTIGISGKRCLISEAARGEGGRLYIERYTSGELHKTEKWYFMEEKYPELGNLMPRDVISREIYFALHDPKCANQVYLDLTGLSAEIWKKKLPDLRKEVQYYLSLDPAKKAIPVEPGIHYFMGGVDVDGRHRTSLEGVYAAGECCSQYHGANRLGGNSLLGAIYGGQMAAYTMIDEIQHEKIEKSGTWDEMEDRDDRLGEMKRFQEEKTESGARMKFIKKLRDILTDAMGIVREAECFQKAEEEMEMLEKTVSGVQEQKRIRLAKAMILSAEMRKESRGAHYRSDFPEADEEYQGKTLVQYKNGTIEIKVCSSTGKMTHTMKQKVL